MKRTILALGACAAACSVPGSGTPTTRPAPPAQQLALYDLIGGWRWTFRTDERGTSRVENETWRLHADHAVPMQLAGRYVRTVEVSSLDHTPFQCNERPSYRQRAVYDVTVRFDGKQFAVHETGFQTEPSPCDHGFRHTGDYEAELAGDRLTLHWDHGTQTLSHVDEDPAAPLPAAPWSTTFEPTGPWRWDATSYDETGNIDDEHEWWEITRRTDTRLDATYRRRVTVRSPDGSPIACASAPSWTYDDAYILDGQKEEEHWHFHELAVEPGDHACLHATPKRNLDEATAEQIGDFLILEWRGKRRQILYRPDGV